MQKILNTKKLIPKRFCMFKEIPNILTILRIFIIPVIIITFYFDDLVFAHRLAAGLFLIAAITDFLDGYLARKFNISSTFGRIMDPIADKLLIASILLMLVKFRKVNEIPALLILMREFLISGLREFIMESNIIMPVSKLAKAKTTFQMIAMFFLILGSKGSGIKIMDICGNICLWFAAILTLLSGYNYLVEYIKITLSTNK